jgi:Flp pilus assembly protein TadB
MDLQELLSRFAVALGIGLLIGLERGWRTREMQSGSRTAGIRTFAVSGLLGAVAAALSQAAGTGAGFVLGASFAAFAAVMIVFCREENRASGNFSARLRSPAFSHFHSEPSR